MLLADLDHFKRINDTLGHPAGDAVLATVSHRLSAALRETDKLVRWGGEEFLAVLDPITPEQADRTVERLLQAVRRDPVLWNGQAIRCTISIGYACFPMAGADTEISLDSAISLTDKALYEAKRRGRNRACLISAVIAQDKDDLTVICEEFESAAADERVSSWTWAPPPDGAGGRARPDPLVGVAGDRIRQRHARSVRGCVRKDTGPAPGFRFQGRQGLRGCEARLGPSHAERLCRASAAARNRPRE